MAFQYDSNGISSTMVAGESLAAAQYKLVELSTTADNTVEIVDGANDMPIGIVANNPVEGGAANIIHAGITKAIAGGSITRGALLKATTAGKVQTATQAATDAYAIVGRALQSAGGDGEVITISLQCLNSFAIK